MSDYLLDDDLLLAVRAARPAVPQEAVSPGGAAARATLERALTSDPDRETNARSAIVAGPARRWVAGEAAPRRRRAGSERGRRGCGRGRVPELAGHRLTGSGRPLGPRLSRLVYQAEPTPQVPVVTSAALNRAVEVMRGRIRQLGVAGASIRILGRTAIAVTLPKFRNEQLAERLIGANAQLEFYDWEANAVTPSGQTVASQLRHAMAPAAVQISQGGSRRRPAARGRQPTALPSRPARLQTAGAHQQRQCPVR